MITRRLVCSLLAIYAIGGAEPALAQVPTCAINGGCFVSDSFTAAANTMVEAHTPNDGGAWTRMTGGNGIIINAAADNCRNVNGNDWNLANGDATASSPNRGGAIYNWGRDAGHRLERRGLSTDVPVNKRP